MRQLSYDVGTADGGGAVRERYRTLGAMLVLGDFSVAEIAAFARVGQSTIRTILGREGVNSFPPAYQVVVRCTFNNSLLVAYEYHSHRILQRE